MSTMGRLAAALADADPIRVNGRIKEVVGLVVVSQGPPVAYGELCHIQRGPGLPPVRAEVVGFDGGLVKLMPIDDVAGLRPGLEVVATGAPLTVPVGEGLLGRVLDAVGEPLDGKPLPPGLKFRPVMAAPPNALTRTRISQPLGLGIRAIDGPLTVGRGQRVGVFSGSGVGKSTVMGMIARYTEADINVIGLVGERGREVREFIERDLGEEGLKRSVVVVATGDQRPLLRLRASFTATTIAEYFRDRGKDVLLMVDSITRFARAQREVGQTVGEPPSTRGYTPSVFAILPVLLERTGTAAKGSITALYTVLVEADDMNEPVADTVRGILDGHIVLSRDLANRGHYPAVDVLGSVSRCMPEITPAEQRAAARKLQRTIAVYRDAEDLINIGAYVAGSSPDIDYAIRKKPMIDAYLQQGITESVPLADSVTQLQTLMAD
ncbi:MAG TPA: FliI/YscN family ATPase [bacterium]|nr:FliI/YscN family ATPase [bacterium]